MAEILITGGAGYIGSVLVPLLLEKGHRVTVVDSFIYRQDSLVGCCSDKNFNIINGDARDKKIMGKAVKGKDFIIPLAALVGFPVCDRDKIAAQTTNYDAIELIFKLRKENQKVIYPCTNSGYGAGKEEEVYTEDSPLNPISLYGRTKVEAEKFVLSQNNTLAFRFATLFGSSPRMRTDLMVNDFVYKAVTDRSLVVFQGHFVRNYLHVRDAAAAFVFAIENFEKMKGRTFNCGLSDSNLTKLELCEKIKVHIPDFYYTEAPINEDPDKRNYIVSNARIENEGFRPQYSLDDGIEELIKVYGIIKNSLYGNV